jgi:hypothetical protein
MTPEETVKRYKEANIWLRHWKQYIGLAKDDDQRAMFTEYYEERVREVALLETPYRRALQILGETVE